MKKTLVNKTTAKKVTLKVKGDAIKPFKAKPRKTA